MAREAMRCILCRAELEYIGHTAKWYCSNLKCELLNVSIPEAAARRLSGLLGTYVATGNPTGRPKKTPAYELDGAFYWHCACCGDVKDESEMDVDRCWCLECKRKSVADTRRRTGRVDRP